MHEFIVLIVHSIVTLARLAKQGGLRSVVAESVLILHVAKNACSSPTQPLLKNSDTGGLQIAVTDRLQLLA